MYSRLQTILNQFASDEGGATAIEYALLTAILAVGLIVGANGIAIVVTNMFSNVAADVAAT